MLTPVFPQFEKALRDEIEQLAVLKWYNQGEILVKQDEPLRNVFIVVEGCFKLYQENTEGNELVIAYLKAGNSLGLTVCDDSAESYKTAWCNCAAIEAGYVLMLSFADKDRLAKKYDRWYKYILQAAGMYNAFYSDLIATIAFEKMDRKIDYFLNRLSKIKNSATLQISHQEIASGLNSSREVVSRILKKMEDAGKIRLGHNTIKLN